jgi:flagellar assembly protein FliH
LSKAFVRASAPVQVSAFTALLPSMAPSEESGSGRARLGRTAEGLHRLQEEAREAGRLEGHAEGLELGRLEGFQAARAEMEEYVEEFRKALDQAAGRVEDRIAEWYAGSEQKLAELSVLIAARILGRELALGGDAISEIVRIAIQEVAAADSIRIRVNPLDVPALSKERSLVLSAHPTVRSVEIVDDPSILGGARIESDSGAIDATIRTQLELAFDAIRGGG